MRGQTHSKLQIRTSSHPAYMSGAPDCGNSGQMKRGDPLEVRGRGCYQAKRRSEALTRQRDARRDLSNHIRRVALEAFAQDAEAEVSACSLHFYKHWLDVCLPLRCLVDEVQSHHSQDLEAVGQPASAEGEAHTGRPRHRPRSHAGDTESAQSFYARQLMQPEWLTDVPVDLASHWCSPGLVVFWQLRAPRADLLLLTTSSRAP